MHRFEIWAPFAKSLSVSVKGVAHRMDGPHQNGWWDGWWRRDVEDATPGADYGFIINDDPACYPDPRSQWQPNGVHKSSRLYDQAAFVWTDAHFQSIPLAAGIIYEMHIGTFTPEGTFDAAITRLDHLVDLGVTYVELMPVAAFEGQYGWGYDGVALYAVHEPYGGPNGLKRFVNAAHEKGLAVLLDVVYNHFGPSGNYTGKFGPYVVNSHHTPWGGAVNLEDAGSLDVRRFFVDNSLMWLRDYHIDGLRIDAVHAFVDRSAIHFLEQLATEVEWLEASLARRFVLIAESDLNDPRVVTPREAGGFGIDAQWSDDFHHALFTVLCPGEKQGYYEDFGSLAQLAKALTATFVYDGIYSRYRNRVHGRSAGFLSQDRFLGYIQNHDQIGNRAFGDRISHIAGLDRAKIAAALVLLGPFIPLIFQGEEWAASSPFQYFANHQDPELAHAVSEGRKKEFSAFGWDSASIPDPESPATFQSSKLEWNELLAPAHREMFAWYRELIRLRRANPSLNDPKPGNTCVTFDEHESWIRMHRGTVTVICNLGASERAFPVRAKSKILLASPAMLENTDGKVALPPDTIAVLTGTAPSFSPHQL
jgi:maltooligosyltrehalose trehalohydrolase